jgi:hypothetical protein
MKRGSTPIFLLFALAVPALATACGDDSGGADAGSDTDTDTDTGTDADADAGSDTDTDTDTDADADAGTDTDTDADAGTDVTELTDNPGTCATSSLVYPLSGEEGQWAAVRLVAPVAVHLDTIRYVLVQQAGAENCRVDLAHEVALFAGDGSTVPPADPEELMRVEVTPEPLAADGPLEVELEVSAPIDLAAGDELFLAVSMAGSYPDVLCWQKCNDDTTPNGNWWAASTEAPYSWATLESYSIPGDLMGSISVTPL